MTSYFAYEHDLPCKNSSCKSYGEPHPNCRCYGMAEGGEAKPFCSETRPHKPDCQYFAGGGTATPPPPGFEVDAPPPPTDGSLPPDFEEDAPPPPPAPAPTPPGKGFFDSDDYVRNLLSDTPTQDPNAPPPPPGFEMDAPPTDYTSGMQKTLAGIEGTFRGIIPGFPWLEEHMNLATIPEADKMMSEEEQNKRAQANPGVAGVSQTAGVLGSLITGGGGPGMIAKGAEELIPSLAAKVMAPGVLRTIGSKIVQGFVTNGLIQGQDEIGKAMLGQGDPEAPVSSALVSMRNMGLIGGGFGAASGAFSAGMSGAPSRWIANKALGNKFISWLMGMGQAVRPDIRADLAAPAAEGATAAPPLNEYEAYKAGQQFAAPEAPTVDLSGQQIPEPDPEFTLNTDAYKKGQQFVNKFNVTPTKMILGGAIGGAGIGAERGFHNKGVTGIPGGALEGAWDGGAVGASAYMLKSATSLGLRKYVVPTMMNMAQKFPNVTYLAQAIDYAGGVQEGATNIANCVEDLFRPGSQFGYDLVQHQQRKDAMDDYISNGGVTQDIQNSLYNANQQQPPPGYAEGGMVAPPQPLGSDDGQTINSSNALADYFPEQNLMLQAARGRISNYLAGLQPAKHPPKLAFDDAPDTTQAAKTYDNALGIAVQPLSVMQKVKDGSLEPEDMQHMTSMYPEVLNHLKKKVTERITQAQLDGEKPTYKVRQALSTFMGAPMSGEMSQPNMQAAQAVFNPPPPAPQAGGPPPTRKKSKTAPLTNSDKSFMTNDQARASRMQADK